MMVGSVDVRLIRHRDRVVWHEERGGFEPETRLAWAGAVIPGRPALDVGAYTGLYGIAAAKLGARAIAVEPVAENSARLAENAAINGVEVEILRVAAGERTGTVKLWANPGSVLPSGARAVPRNGQSVRCLAPVVRLDDLCFFDVAAIKVDVERNEPEVLLGLAMTIELARPVIFAEALGQEEQEAIERAIPRYRVHRLLDGRNLMMVPA